MPEDDEVIVHYNWEEEEDKQEIKEEYLEEKKETKKKDKKIEKKAAKKQDSLVQKKPKVPSKAKKNSKNQFNKTYVVLGIIAAIIIIILAAFFMSTSSKEPSADQLVVAKVNNEAITLAKLDRIFDISVPKELKLTVTKEQFLDSTLIPQTLLRQEAITRGFRVTEEEIDNAINTFIAQNQLTREEYLQRISLINVTVKQMQEFYSDQIIIAKLVNQTLQEEIEVTDREIEKYYNANKDLFEAQSGQIRASHILVSNVEEAYEILDLLREGANFEELAAERSQDPSAKINNGNLGFFGQGAMVAEFDDAAFNLEENQLSEPVETQFGLHIILRKSNIVSLEEAANAISNALRSSKQEALFRTTVSQLRSKSDIEVYIGQELPILETEEIKLTFEETGDELCTEDDKPVIRMFSTSSCPRCNWIKDSFDSVASEFMQQNKIIAYHWQLDSGDNTLTQEMETKIPKSEFDIFQKYNPKSTVPTYVIGCKYVRIGNAFEKQENLEAEAQQFKEIIEKII